MNSLLHREGDSDIDDQPSGGDREIHLGMTLILGLFLGLALLCAAFFGLGYSMGRKSVGATPAAGQATQTGTSFAGFKPAAGSVLTASSDKPAPSESNSVTLPLAPSPAGKPTKVAADEDPADGAVVGDPLPAPAPKATAVAAVATPAPATPVATPGGAAIVQVAAVSHQEDADLLVTTLKRRGYAVAIRNEPQDKLLHVQVGPFATHKDADTMRQKLLADGFNAIVKDVK